MGEHGAASLVHWCDRRRRAAGVRSSDRLGSLGDMDPGDRSELLCQYHEAEVLGCTRCALHQTRTQVVAGSGDPEAAIMFVGEAPGYHEDRSGVPFVGAAGKLLDQMLGEIGLRRDEVFVANVLKCRPPGNRDPLAGEISSCEPHLFRQVAIIRPRMICTLGNFATKLISGRPDSISRVHGCELEIAVGGHPVILYPLFHPAAALYTPAMLDTLRADFRRIPQLVGLAGDITPITPATVAEDDQSPAEVEAEPPPASEPRNGTEPAAAPQPEQLGLF